MGGRGRGTDASSSFPVGLFYTSDRHRVEYDGDEFSESSADDSDRDRTYIQENISEESEESDGDSLPVALDEGVPQLSPSSWLYSRRSKSRGSCRSSRSNSADESDNDDLSITSDTLYQTPPSTRQAPRPSFRTRRVRVSGRAQRGGRGRRGGRARVTPPRSADHDRWSWLDGADFVPKTFSFDEGSSGVIVDDLPEGYALFANFCCRTIK